MLRIIAGFHRHKTINQPDLKITRPTIEKIREAIFNSIAFKIEDKNFLDLFSGSGVFAIEASSRGAKNIYAIEKSKKAYDILNENIEKLQITNINTALINATTFLNSTNILFDFIFIDPPFENTGLLNESLKIINERMLLNKDGEIIVETDKPDKIELPIKLKIFKEKKYGKISIIYITYC